MKRDTRICPEKRGHASLSFGFCDLARKGFFAKDSDVVFLHTGGSAGLFGYPDAFDLPGYT